MAKVLWVIDFLHVTTPRRIRTRALIQHLSTEHEIHVLSLDARSEGTPRVPYQGHQLHGNKIGQWYWRIKKTPWSSYSRAEKCFRIVPKLAHVLLSKFVFPCAMVLHVKRYRKLLQQLLHNEDFQVVVLCVTPFTNYMLAATTKENGGVKLICDVGDPLVENSAMPDTDGSLTARIKQLEGNALSLADCVVVTNLGTKEHFLRHYGDKIDPSDIYILPNGTTAPTVLPEDAARDVPDRSGWRLAYAGAFYQKLREPYSLFQAVRSLADKDVHLSLYGPRNQFTTGKEIDGRCIEYKGQISYEEVPLAYHQADILVFIDNAYGVQTSSKIFELIAAKKPLLFIYENEESPTLELIRDYSGAVICKNDPKDIQRRINEIMEHPGSLSFDYDIEPFLWENRCKEFGRLIDEVLSP